MKMLSYERLSRIVKESKPYRKSNKVLYTQDRYPLDWRKHSHKCFFVKKDAQGNNEYHIAYSQYYSQVSIDEVEYKIIKASSDPWRVSETLDGGYAKYDRDWHVLGVVRNDNTFEFTTDIMHQGDRMFLTSLMGVYHSEIISSVNHGGTIYREYVRNEEKTNRVKHEDNRWRPQYWKDTMVMPIFKGQRFNIDTNRSVIDYEVHLPYVNRKRSKEVMEEYKDQLNFAETMFKTMTSEVFASEMRDVFNEVFPDDNKPRWGSSEAIQKVCEYANKNLKNDLYRYMYTVMLTTRSLNSWAIGCNNQSYSNDRHHPLSYFQNSKAKFVKTLKLISNALDKKVYKANELYPSNSWEVKILVDGNVVRAY